MTDYKLLKNQLISLAEEEANYLPLLSNASALIFEGLTDLNWAGFYLMNKGSLLLGPFQGKVACIRIPLGEHRTDTYQPELGRSGTARLSARQARAGGCEIRIPSRTEAWLAPPSRDELRRAG